MGASVLAEHLRNQQDPFQLTPDPKFCYLDPARRQASARLLSGLYAGDGLFMLTGRAGIGKSMLLRHLAEQLTGLEAVYPLAEMQVLACRTGMAFNDILGACESRLRLGASAAAPLKAAKQLQRLVDSARSPVLLLDDADLLADEVLEAIFTLSGLQASDRSLLSVVLAGHPGMVARLSAIGGVSVGHSHPVINLEPMAEADAARLIWYRLRTAERSEDAFGADAIDRIVRHAAGIPLNIVRICRRALEMGDRRSLKGITADLVAEAISEDIAAVPRDSARSASAAGAKPDSNAHSRSPRQPTIAAAVPPGASAQVDSAPFSSPSTQPPTHPETVTPPVELRLLEPLSARPGDAP